MISVNLVWQFILAQMFGFIVLLFILNFLLYKPVIEIIRKRQEYILNLLAESQKLKEEAKAKLEQYHQEKLNAEEEGKKIFNSMLEEARKIKEEKLAQINELFKKEQAEFASAIEQDIKIQTQNIDSITNQISSLLLKNIVKGEG
ncbi:ATP synthase F0 subunit B [Desulfurella multipotens]|uniref:ATP synthase F0 subunit B n=1 Tax=Desulfurella TaxID=33001 RepID=UPI0023577751|nr:ATP synthase F0 subunit B [Desulfurella multipotens]